MPWEDYARQRIIKGAVDAVSRRKGYPCGGCRKEDIIKSGTCEYTYDKEQIEDQKRQRVIETAEPPMAIRERGFIACRPG